MKKSMSLCVLVALCQFYSASAQPRNVHLSWNGSARESTSTSMTITWSADAPNKGAVKYNTDQQLSLVRPASEKYSTDASVYVYTATLNNLQPNTTYYYQCGADPGGWSQVYSFKTAPVLGSQDKFVVGVWGDTQDNEFNTQFEKTDTVVKLMRKFPIQFTIHTGDIVNTGSQVPSWLRLFATTQPINAIAPFMPVPGNHDVDNKLANPGFQKPFPVFYDLFNLPGEDTDYSFNYGNAHFVAINSGHAKGVEEANATNWRYATDSPEYQWLEKDLAQARQDKNTAWIIIYMHHPLYSFGWSHVQGWQERITPLLDKYNVDLALAGHRHVYERHRAIRNNKPIAMTDAHLYTKPAGTVYITNGTAGGSPQGLGGSDMPSMVFTSAAKMYNYSIMTIEGKRILYEVYNEKNEKIDHFKLSK
ncbi:MAG: metallophosphoesterase family protein [Ferruginibacter sp.]|nr:metallophosphoesterase family protein [Cytophagales bacterium]